MDVFSHSMSTTRIQKTSEEFIEAFSEAFGSTLDVGQSLLFPCARPLRNHNCVESEWRTSSSPFHGRSIRIDHDQINSGRYHFAKGIGWTACGGVMGWNRSVGNIGILTKKAATQEFKIADILASLGLGVIAPLAILDLEVPVYRDQADNSYQEPLVLDLDQSPAEPSIFVYSSPHPDRVCDLFLMDNNERVSSLEEAYALMGCSHENYMAMFTKNLAKNVGRLHSLGGHNYASSTHNIFVDGTLVDFEYCFLPTHGAIDPVLSQDTLVWQHKEILGWIETLSTLNALPGVASQHSVTLIRTFIEDYCVQSEGIERFEFLHFLQQMIACES
jgi:hypothetical protein